MQAKGSNGSLAIDFEDVPGSLNETPKPIELKFTKSSVKAEQNQSTSNVIRGRRDPTEPFRGFINVSGNVETPLDLGQTGYVLKAAFGAPVTTPPGEGKNLYTHVFKLGQAMPSFTLEQGFKDIGVYMCYIGCKINKLSFSFGGDGELLVSADVMGMKEVLQKSALSNSPKIVEGGKLNFDNANLKEADQEIAIATEVSVDVDFALDGEYCLGGKGFRSSVNEGMTDINGTVKLLFENEDLLNKAISGETSSLEIPLIRGDQSLTISLPEVKYKRNTPGIDGPKGVLIEMQYNAFYQSNADDTAIKFTLVNDIASYE